MAGEPYITVVGNLAADPELRFTQGGDAVVNFTIAQTPRTMDRQTQQWVDDETLWVRTTVWREAAQNVAESLVKGTRVVAYGKLRSRSFEDKEGNQRTNWELDAEEVGPSLRWATAQVQRSNSGGGGGQQQQQQGGYAGGNPWQNSQYAQQPQQAQQPMQQQPMQQQGYAQQPMQQPQQGYAQQPWEQAQQQQVQQPQQGAANVWQGGQPQPGQGDGPPPF